MLAEFNQGLICQGLDMPHVTGCGEHTCGFEHQKHEVTDGSIGQLVPTGNRDVLHFA